MKIYIASKYGRREEMGEVAAQLVAAGHEVTSRWLNGEETEDQSYYAIMDVEDVQTADAVLTFTEPYGSLNKGGGRHFELGLAFAWQKPCYIVGPKEIIFHHLPQMFVFVDLNSAIEAMEGI